MRSFYWLTTIATALLAWSCTATLFEGNEPGECTDGADNDADGLYDCADPNCAGAPICQGDPTEANLFDDMLQGSAQLDSLCARLTIGNVQSVVRDAFCTQPRPQVTNSQQLLEVLGLPFEGPGGN